MPTPVAQQFSYPNRLSTNPLSFNFYLLHKMQFKALLAVLSFAALAFAAVRPAFSIGECLPLAVLLTDRSRTPSPPTSPPLRLP